MDYSSPFGYERTQVALSCPRLTGKASAFEEWRWSFLQFVEGMDPKFLIFLADEHGPMPKADLKTYITPTAAEINKATEGKAAGDPRVPLEDQLRSTR